MAAWRRVEGAAIPKGENVQAVWQGRAGGFLTFPTVYRCLVLARLRS